MTNILINYDIAMVISKITNIYSIFVQICLIVLSFKFIEKRYIKNIINTIIIIFLFFTGFFLYTGYLSEQNIDEFAEMVYFGQIENGKANGWGRLFDEERNIRYIGYFHNNKFDGEGRIYETGKYDEILLLYDGEIRNNEYNGKGIRYYYNDYDLLLEYYDGGWAYGERFGFGFYEWKESALDKTQNYIGTFVSNKFDGQGVYYSDGEIIYDGHWSNDTYDGKGILNYTNEYGEKRRYEGEFSNGVPNGHGIVYDEDDNPIQEGVYENDEFKKASPLN